MASKSALIRTSVRALLAVLLTVLGLTQVGRVEAQVTLDRYQPAPSLDDGFAISRPGTTGHLRASGALQLDYGLDPLVWETRLGEGNTGDTKLVHHHLRGHALGSLALYDRVLVFVQLPVDLVMDGTPLAGIRAEGAGLGNILAGARVRLLGDPQDSGALSLQGTVGLPTASWADEDNELSGANKTTGHIEVLGEARPGPARISGELGVLFRDAELLSTLDLGHELSFGVGLGYVVLERPKAQLELMAEIYGSTSLEHFGRRELTPLEATGGAKVRHRSGFVAGGAFGPGIGGGYGSPVVRAIALVGYSPPPFYDRDHDKIADDLDKCPSEAEDRDNFQDDDGCPDLDDDGDGIPDLTDGCKDQPETVNHFQDEDGCPEPDADGDHHPDAADKCPAEPEDADSFQDDDGCPDPDNDNDGVLDAQDACPLEAEDKDGFRDEDGCPDPDHDGDGIPDEKDQCPNEAETLNGREDEDGCPDLVRVDRELNQIVILEQVRFALNKSEIDEASYPMLMEIAEVLKTHTEIKQLLVEGHTDNKGNPAKNQKLSEARANAVRDFLIEAGTSEDRLTARGLGATRPRAENKTEAGRLQNRRVEFHIQDANAAPP